MDRRQCLVSDARPSRRPRARRVAFLVAALTFGASAVGAPAGVVPGEIEVHTNQAFLESLAVPLDLDDPLVVLEVVFAGLDGRVRVYPTENYYYYRFHAAGTTVAGNLRLDAADRDRGILHVGYFRYDENGQFQDRRGVGRALSADDGVEVERLEPFLYAVTFRGKRVLFELNDVGFHPPRQARLRPTEEFVGPIFDESGLRFALLFDRSTRHLFYVLDEDLPVPESFVPASADVVVGRRTGFAFYLDEANRRKVLIAVHAAGMDTNSYYDGPFDQLPDNYVARTGIRRYIESAYPHTRGRLDPFGAYTDEPAARVAILAYHVYDEREDLSFVASCRQTSGDEAELLACVTPDPQQRQGPAEGLVGIGGVRVGGSVAGREAPRLTTPRTTTP
jgi:hypothetical protein